MNERYWCGPKGQNRADGIGETVDLLSTKKGRSFLWPNCPSMERVDSRGSELPVGGNVQAETGWSQSREAVEGPLHQPHDLFRSAAIFLHLLR